VGHLQTALSLPNTSWCCHSSSSSQRGCVSG